MLASASLGSGTAAAAPPAANPTFSRAEISLTSSGGLQCSFRETGLGSLAQVTYDCGAKALGVVWGCFAKNKFVGPTALSVFYNVTTEGGEPLLAKNNGAIGATITVEVPESEGALSCTGTEESQVVTVRWCEASLLDVTNNILGATYHELFAQLARTGTAPITTTPSCSELLAAMPTGGD